MVLSNMRRMTRLTAFQIGCGLLAFAGGCRVEKIRFADSAAGEVARTPASRACGITNNTVLTGDGIGALRIGQSVAAIAATCQILSDSTLATGSEAVTRRMRVDLLRDTVDVDVEADTIRGIQVADSAFHTMDHFSVDTRVAKILTLADVEGRTSGGSLWVVSPSHCGLSFRLEGPAPTPPAAQSGKAALRRLAGEERVDRISILGCGTRP